MTLSVNMKTATVTSLAFGPLFRCAHEVQPASEHEVRTAAGPLPTPLSLDEHRPVDAYFDAWEALERLIGAREAVFGAQRATSLADLQVFGFLAMTAENLAEAFRRIAAVRMLWANGSGWLLRDESRSVRLTYSPWPTERRGGLLATEYMLADMIGSIREIVGEPVQPVAVLLSHEALAPLEQHTRFFGVEPTCDASENAIVLDASVGAMPVLRFDTRLHDFFVGECDAIASRLGDGDDWLSVVRKEVARAHRHEVPTADGVARALGLSPRSMRRRFADAGTTFRAVRQDVAVEIANAYLRRGMSASETAFAMGYSEPSAFSRAYKNWTGVAPRLSHQRGRDATE